MADDANSSLPPVPGDGRGLLPLWGEALLYIGALLLCLGLGLLCLPHTYLHDTVHAATPVGAVMMAAFFFGVPLVTSLAYLYFLPGRSTAFLLCIGVLVVASYALGFLIYPCVAGGLLDLGGDAYAGMLFLPFIHQLFLAVPSLLLTLLLTCRLSPARMPAVNAFAARAIRATGILFIVSLAVSGVYTWVCAA